MEVREHEGAPDARLAAAAGRGDDEAFAVLYVRYAPRIGAYLTRLLDDEHLAQDLTHEVFVSALRRLRISRPPIAFGPWLYRIARNASIDVHRRSQLVRQVSLDGSAEDGVVLPGDDGPETVAEMRQWLDDLRDLLGSLSETHRSVLVLREFEGLSNTEIGKRLGVSRPAVEGLLFRARAKMRREYDDLVSGRRCETVQGSLDRAAAGRRLPRREFDLAERHLRACVQCRRHAFEAGVSGMFDRSNGRSALFPVPVAVAALLARLNARLHGSPALSAPWGRAAAAVTVLAVAGSTVMPAVRDQLGSVAAPQQRAARPVATAQPRIARSAAAVPTTHAEPAAGASSAPILIAATGPAPSPAAAPTRPPGDRAEIEPAAQHPAGGAPPAASSPADEPAVEPAATVARAPLTAREAARPVTSRLPKPAVAVADHAAETATQVADTASELGDTASELGDEAGGTLVDVAETASQAAQEVLPPESAPASAPAVPAPPVDAPDAVQDGAGAVQDAAGQAVDAVPAASVPVADPPATPPVPVPADPPVPAPPPVPKPTDPRQAGTASTAVRNGTTTVLR